MFQAFGIAIIIVLLATLGFGYYRTYQTQTDSRNQQFIKGTVPNPLPNGLQKGVVNLNTTWQGKKFDSEKQTGINLFMEHGDLVEKYPFKTYIGKGLVDPNLTVEKIDYNIVGNPLWLRFILDEIVQTDKEKYLGKLSIRVLPGINFALGYFNLEKQHDL